MGINISTGLSKQQFQTLTTTLEKIMAGLTDVQTALAAEKADLATLSGLITQLLSAFASGALTPSAAQSLLDEVTADRATVATSIAAIKSALPTPPPPGP